MIERLRPIILIVALASAAALICLWANPAWAQRSHCLYVLIDVVEIDADGNVTITYYWEWQCFGGGPWPTPTPNLPFPTPLPTLTPTPATTPTPPTPTPTQPPSDECLCSSGSGADTYEVYWVENFSTASGTCLNAVLYPSNKICQTATIIACSCTSEPSKYRSCVTVDAQCDGLNTNDGYLPDGTYCKDSSAGDIGDPLIDFITGTIYGSGTSCPGGSQ